MRPQVKPCQRGWKSHMPLHISAVTASSRNSRALQIMLRCIGMMLGRSLKLEGKTPNPKPATLNLPEPQMTCLSKDVYQEITLGTPKTVGYLRSSYSIRQRSSEEAKTQTPNTQTLNLKPIRQRSSEQDQASEMALLRRDKATRC